RVGRGLPPRHGGRSLESVGQPLAGYLRPAGRRFELCEDDRMTDPRRDPQVHEAQHSFDVVLRGYDRNQVAETIERIEEDFRIALADRDAAVARSSDLAAQLSALHGEIETLRRKAASASAPTFENISERIQHMLQLAE